MDIDIHTIFHHFRQKIDNMLATMHDEHQQKGLIIRRDTEPVSLEELHHQLQLQIEEIRHREEVGAAIAEKYHLDMQHRVRTRNATLLHDSTQRAMQSALANTLEQPPKQQDITQIETVCLNDVVERTFATHTPIQSISALEYIEQGGLEETVPRIKTAHPPTDLPVEWSPLRERAPLPEEIQSPQEQDEPQRWSCERRRGESLQSCFKRCKDEYTEMYGGKAPKCIYVSADDNTTLSFFTLSLSRRERAGLEDGCMVAEG